VFVLLVAEMALFVALILPMPFKVKRKLFNFIAESPIVAKLQYGMKVCLQASLTGANRSNTLR
jgi:B-cell receptor-associated protein 31